MRRHIALLLLNKNIRILATIQLICYFGGWFSYTGIFTLLIELHAPIWAISFTAAMAFVPGVVLAPISGVIIDKFKPFSLFISFMLIECITVLLLILVDSMSWFWFMQLIVFIRMGLAGMYFQVEMSLLPKLLTRSHLKLANEIHSVIWAVSYTAGMGLAGIYIHNFGIYSSFVFDSILYAIGIALLFKLKLPQLYQSKKQKVMTMLKDGLAYIKNSPLMIHLIIIHSFVGITSYDTLIALMADYKYKEILSTSLIIGFMNMSRACSLILGPIILSKFTNTKTLFWLFIGQFLGIGIWSILQFDFYVGFIGLVCAGFCTSTLWSYSYTLIQNHCDKEYHGRVVAYVDMVFLGISALTSLAIGFLYKVGLSLSFITFLMGFAFFIGAFYYRYVIKKFSL